MPVEYGWVLTERPSSRFARAAIRVVIMAFARARKMPGHTGTLLQIRSTKYICTRCGRSHPWPSCQPTSLTLPLASLGAYLCMLTDWTKDHHLRLCDCFAVRLQDSYRRPYPPVPLPVALRRVMSSSGHTKPQAFSYQG